jgi:hypothetical protein
MHKKAISIVLVIVILGLLITIPFMDLFITGTMINTVKDLLPIETDLGIELFYGVVGILVLILIIILVIVNKGGRKRSKKEQPKKGKFHARDARRRREEITQELKEAEKRFLKHKIDKETFDKISKEKNAELIRLEAELDTKKKERLNFEEAKALDTVSKDKRQVLSGLMEQKQKKVHELKIAERSYLKRKIDEKTFKKISSEVKQEIISIEGKIRAIHKSEEVEKLKSQLKEGAREIAKQKNNTTARVGTTHSFEGDVFQQLEYEKR